MRKLFLLLVSISFVFVIGCSSSEEQTKKENESEIQKEEYVFDAPAIDSTTDQSKVEKIPTPVAEPEKKFVVQIGAFTTKARADERAAFAKKKLAKEIIVSFSDEFKLYVVQLKPFATRAEADLVKNELWNSKDFKDAFIVVNP